MENSVFLPMEYRYDFISVNNEVAISSHGNIFKIGDKVTHDAGEGIGVIQSFSIRTNTNDVIAHTDKGAAAISFLRHLNNEKTSNIDNV